MLPSSKTGFPRYYPGVFNAPDTLPWLVRNPYSRLETNQGDGQQLVDFKMVVATTNLWLKVSNLENELILLEFENFILLVAQKIDWRHEEMRGRVDWSREQLDGDTSYWGKLPVFSFSTWIDNIIIYLERNKNKRELLILCIKFGCEFRTYRWRHAVESRISGLEIKR